MERTTISVKVWGVIGLLGLFIMMMMVQHVNAQREAYACWGGCYNECILQTGMDPSQRLPCYFNCLGTCFFQPASGSPYQYYCQLGCSMDQCSRYSSDGWKMEGCLNNCSTTICNINNV